ncbi:MAG: LytTR family DNA-binding domain-containing protein [Alloprevotella sp.]|nr:LytTR family DNA-binding domain-containing protein [Alloprevotella sp.]
MIHCVAIDDEPIALTVIAAHCKRLGGIDLKCFTSPAEGMACVNQTLPDIVFLDIELSSADGVKLAGSMPAGVCVVFTTAHSHYALDGFDVDAVDFLHKPIFYPRFCRAVSKARVLIEARRRCATCGPTITLMVEYKTVVVSVSDITHIEAMDNYVKVYRTSGPTVVSQISMKAVSALLPPDDFVRVHRSFIVSLSAVVGFTSRRVYLASSGVSIPVGRTYSRAVLKRLGQTLGPRLGQQASSSPNSGGASPTSAGGAGRQEEG